MVHFSRPFCAFSGIFRRWLDPILLRGVRSIRGRVCKTDYTTEQNPHPRGKFGRARCCAKCPENVASLIGPGGNAGQIYTWCSSFCAFCASNLHGFEAVCAFVRAVCRECLRVCSRGLSRMFARFSRIREIDAKMAQF